MKNRVWALGFLLVLGASLASCGASTPIQPDIITPAPAAQASPQAETASPVSQSVLPSQPAPVAVSSAPEPAQPASAVAAFASVPDLSAWAAGAAGVEWQYVLSTPAEVPKYEPGFSHFDYVNPNAPKGGTARMSALLGYDNFNPLMGMPPSGLAWIYETLMVRPLDAVGTYYGLIAEAFRHPEDHSWASFRLHPDARWHDGQPITPGDVVWSFDALLRTDPRRAVIYADVAGVAATGEREVTFFFGTAGGSGLLEAVAGLIVLPQHWWEGMTPSGRTRSIDAPTMEFPLGSGPYRIESYTATRVTYARVENAWASHLPVNVGSYNFDLIEYHYYPNPNASFQALLEDEIDWLQENAMSRWNTVQESPIVLDGRVVLEEFSQRLPYASIAGFVPNLRRPIFQDPILREAIAYAFDFETIARGLATPSVRIDSYFFGTPYASSGLPDGLELEILEEVRDLVPPRVFTQEYTLPVGGTPQALNENLAVARSLLADAGYRLEGNRLFRPGDPQRPNAPREPVMFDILLNGPALEGLAVHLRNNLAQLGIQMNIRSVDNLQYANRLRARDYDMIYTVLVQPLPLGSGQRDLVGSASANREGSSNYAGIADPGVDHLIERLLSAEDHETSLAAARALDRVLLAHHFMIPSYASLPVTRIARWDRFARPDRLPEYSIGFPQVWWQTQ